MTRRSATLSPLGRVMRRCGKIVWVIIEWSFLLPIGVFFWFKNKKPSKKRYYVPKIVAACLLLSFWVYVVIYLSTGHSKTYTIDGNRVTIHCVSAQCNDVAKKLDGGENLKTIASIGVVQIEDPKSTSNKNIKTVNVYASNYRDELTLALLYDDHHTIRKITNADFPTLVYFSKGSTDGITKYPALATISSLKTKAKAEAKALELANEQAEKQAKADAAAKAAAQKKAAAKAKADAAAQAKAQKDATEKSKQGAAARAKAAQNKAKADAAAKAAAQKKAAAKAKADAAAQAKAGRLNGYANAYCSAHTNTSIPLPYYDGSIWKLSTTSPTRYLTAQNCLDVATYLVNQLKLSDGSQFLNDVLSAKIAIGMNYYEALLAWGMPNDVNNTTTALGTFSQWVYGSPLYGANYVYVNNGIVESYQTF